MKELEESSCHYVSYANVKLWGSSIGDQSDDIDNITKSIYHGKHYWSQNIFKEINSGPHNNPSVGLLCHYPLDDNDLCYERNSFQHSLDVYLWVDIGNEGLVKFFFKKRLLF